jgi:Xaa-Pro aminopeptidase
MSALAEKAHFTETERDWRWARVRAAMDDAAVDLLVVLPFAVPTDVRYLAQEIGAVLFPLDIDPWIVLGGEDSHLAVERSGWIQQRSSATPNGSSRVSYGAAVASKLDELRLRPARVGIVGLTGSPLTNVRLPEGYVTYETTRRIIDALGDTDVVDGTPILAAARSVKSDAELDELRSSVRIAEAAADAIHGAFQLGATQADAYRAGLVALAQPGVSELNLAWSPGRWGHPRPRLMAAPPGTIDDGLCVAAEIYPAVRGYVAQVAEPFIAGAITAEQSDAFELNLAAFDAACAALRPGATWRDVKAATVAVADGTPWKVCFLLHSGPDGPLFVPNDDNEAMLDVEVVEGSAYICKPHVYPADAGRYVARSHDVAWGDTVVVRANGAERLGTRARRLVAHESSGTAT